MNPYAKIGIKIAVVVVICLIVLVAWNMVGGRAFKGAARKWKRDLNAQKEIATKLDSLLKYTDELPKIRQVQIQDIQTIRNLIPDADEFMLTSYLRQIHNLLSDNHLETDGIVIGGRRASAGGTNFDEAFSSDVSALQEDLERITNALQMFRDRMDEMNNMFVSFQFYEELGTGAENFKVIIGGIESHNFGMTVRGSYSDIKKFTYNVFNMRPHTALINFQMAPQGSGHGKTRQYSASFTLITYGDANTPPPLWEAWKHGVTIPSQSVTIPSQEDIDEGAISDQVDEGDVNGEEAED